MTAPAAAVASPEAIAARSGSNFLIGFRFLPAARRTALTAIYAFCRVVDDAVDDSAGPQQAREQLAFWRAELEAAVAGSPATATGRGLQQAIARFSVDPAHLRAVVAGVALDLSPPVYPDLAALEAYCHGVASAVGLACLPVLGAVGPDAEGYAERLGKALQLTNILRDLAPDAAQGRVYVPADWLRECGVEPQWLLGRGPDAAYAPAGPLQRLCARFDAAAAAHFAAATAALRRLPRRARRCLVPARIMGAVYADLLVRLRRRGGELRAGRVRVPKAKKLLLAALVLAGARA